MKAWVCERYGPPQVLRLVQRPDPKPAPGEVLVRVRACTVSSGDARVRALRLPEGFGLLGRLALGWSGPRVQVLGAEFAGEIMAVGPGVSHWREGDRVFGIDGLRMGAHAQIKRMRSDAALAAMPAGMTFEQAACISFGAGTALDFLRRAALKPGEHVLVNGASGSVGSAAVQIARHLGAQVTAVCSARHAPQVSALGAHELIDYQQHDFTASNRRFDLVLDTVGQAPWPRLRAVLSPRGRLLQVVAPLADLLLAPLRGRGASQRVIAGPVAERAEPLRELADWVMAGALTPWIGSRHAFADLVQVHALVDSGHKQGNAVVRVDD